MQPIREELDLGDQKKAFKGKTIKIKKLVKKETGSFTLKDTYIQADDSMNASGLELDPNMVPQHGQHGEGYHQILNNEHYTQEQSSPEQFNFSKQGQSGPREVRM
jgi:hypothetical protein